MGTTTPDTIDRSSAMKTVPMVAQSVEARALKFPRSKTNTTMKWMSTTMRKRARTAISRAAKSVKELGFPTHCTDKIRMSNAKRPRKYKKALRGSGQIASICPSTPNYYYYYTRDCPTTLVPDGHQNLSERCEK
jgi:hypothetical protein